MANKKNPQATAEYIMTNAGVPRHVIDYVLERNPKRLLSALFAFFQFFIMLVGFFIGAVGWFILAHYSDANAVSFGNSVGAVLYEDLYGISMSFLLFAWLFALPMISEFFERTFPRIGAMEFVFSHLDHRALQWKRYRNFLESIKDTPEPRDYLREVTKRKSRWGLKPALLLIAVSFIALDQELDSYTVYTPDGYYSKPILPWESDVEGDWRDAEKVELGCNHVTGKNASDNFLYKIWIGDDRAYHFGAATAIEGNLLDHLETIDETLKQEDVIFQRFDWLDRDPLHPACLKAQKTQFGATDAERIFRLIQVGAFEGD